MLKSMTSSEITEWMAYFSLEAKELEASKRDSRVLANVKNKAWKGQ